MQVLVPIQEHNEMDFNIVAVAEKMNEDPQYRKLSYEAYGKLPDAFVITRAIAAFERTLLSGYSKYDTGQLSESEQRGMALFLATRWHAPHVMVHFYLPTNNLKTMVCMSSIQILEDIY